MIDELLDLYYRMLRIRMVEEAIADAYPQQKMRTPIHLSIGQEAVAAASGKALSLEDYAVSTHRAHAHYLAKGGSLKAMLAEIHGKVTGCCRGRGGSMHLVDKKVGFLGSTAIVGNTIPIGVGLGLTIKLEGTSQVSCVYIGDGAVEEGAFYESLNFAVVRRLPVIFVCENNSFSVYTPFHKRQPADRRIYQLTEAMGCKSLLVDGNDPIESYNAMQEGLHYIRNEQAPCLIEFTTYRWREHCGPNYDHELNYRDHTEFLNQVENDPVVKFKEHLSLANNAEDSVFTAMRLKIDKEISDAFYFAEHSSFPEQIEAVTGEYKQPSIQEEVLCEV